MGHLTRVLRWLGLVPYVVFFVVVLAPVALVAYAMAAVVRTAYSNVVAGWNEHK